MYYAIFGIVLFATLAMMVREGLWANLIALFTLLVGGLTAFGIYQPIVVMIDEATEGSYTYLLDFVVLWLVFALVVGVLKGLGGVMSPRRLRFKEPINPIGGPIVGLVAAVLVACFTMATFHAAPLGATDFFPELQPTGTTVDAVATELDGLSVFSRPDVAWLRLAETALSPDRLGGSGFSPAIYVFTLGQHRDSFQKMTDVLVDRK
ncbi:CvpA family protein [Botrimarina hoheduenensis]|uniref:Colicin V production protein n=1 Tax=Botrimarina hoheduenensis TaxID=2528000 RepID=A0A5C5W0Z4_9BACT|nr:CvpA family protein [Botrimarina hoheduenensis]TWT43442.1 Colicin V production protein [Botrimarina hoheduenensis]